METFLEKLDRELGHWLGAWDNHLQQPIMQVMTGKVFTHGTSSMDHNHLNGQEHPEPQAVKQSSAPHATPTREPNTKDGDGVRPVWSKNAV